MPVPFSDRRRAGGSTAVCRLCEQESVLLLGHVVAKWMHRWIKEEGGGRLHGQFSSLNVDNFTAQDATKHYMLCARCEQHMSESESYMRTVMVGTEDERRALGVFVVSEWISGLDVELVQRFVLGTAFRAHFATGAPYHRFALEEECIERMRKTILSGSANDDEFPIAAQRFVSETVPGADPRSIVRAYLCPPSDRPALFCLFAAGWEWLSLLRRGVADETIAPPDVHAVRLCAARPFHVPISELVEHPTIPQASGRLGAEGGDA